MERAEQRRPQRVAPCELSLLWQVGLRGGDHGQEKDSTWKSFASPSVLGTDSVWFVLIFGRGFSPFSTFAECLSGAPITRTGHACPVLGLG